MNSEIMTKPKILVVDDEPDNLDLLYRTFYRDYKVLRAESGPAALDILASEGDIAVIISDQRMPYMTGTEFLSLTATQYPDTIRIILTGYTDVDDLVEAINSGKVFKYVTKPWEAEELQAVVRQALDTHNVLKTRTQELCRTLRQESLLNTVTNTIRSRTNYRQILQTIVNTVGHMLEADICILRPCQDNQMEDECFIFQRVKPVIQPAQEVLEASNSSETENSSLPLVAQTVWETHDVLVFDDVTTDDRLSPQATIAFQSADIRSSLIVPLICQMEPIAVLALHQCGQQRRWQDDEVQLVFMVADQAALALAQARAYERSLAMAKREALINTITTAIRSSLDPKDIFAAITQQLGQALNVDGCALSLWTETDEYVQCVGLYDKSVDVSVFSVEVDLTEANFAKQTFAADPIDQNFNPNGNSKVATVSQLPQSVVPIAGNPVLLQLLSTQQPVVIDNLDTVPQMQGFDLPLRTSARALMVVPLVTEGRIIGSISLREATRSRRWQQVEIDLAQAVAAQAAIAVEHARLYQKTRQQAERLQELDRQKTEFFQNISHEFRTPLTLMMGPLESAVNQHQGLPYDQAVIALRNCRRLLRLVNQLLDLQRLDAGRMQASFRPCDLVTMVSQIVESFRPYCEKKGLRLITDLNNCPKVYLDPEKFDKVLYNLLSNAMKFTDAGGSIAIKVEPAGDHIRIQVKDTGIGIRTEQIPHLFERFRQAEGSVNRSYEGSGLGLALVKELVELHGGQVSVESIYQAGTTFTVWLQTGTAHLPLDQVLEVPTQVQSARAAVELADLELLSAGQNPTSDLNSITESETEDLVPNPGSSSVDRNTILVVDDNADLRSYVSRVLKASGFEVLMARDGAEGFGVAQARQPDLIVTDLMMPMVSGMDMIRMIREQADIKGTPIILLTAKVDEDTRIEGTELGADIYLAKPFNDRELLAAVRNLLALKANERKLSELNTYLTESVLKRFLPTSLVQKAKTGQLSLDLRPEPKLVTILFSDIVGFTQLSNTLRSRRVAELLNEYLDYMTRAVFENGGTVDKFMGDAVLAMFGAPEELTPNEQVKRAIATARKMRQHLDNLNARWQEQGIPRVQFRCGIHQGTAVVGMFGSPERADYTAIGPTVNIASRLQAHAEPSCILVSAAVADYLDESEITKGSPLQLKGVDETVLTFVVDPKPKQAE